MTTPTVRFGPDRRLTIAAAAATVVALASALLYPDPPGRLLFAIAAVVLAAYAIGDLVWADRLVADASGVRIRTPFTRADLAWTQISAVRADVRTRHGLRSATLEVDAGDVLVVFSRRTLGADPEAAAGLVNAMRP
ncbi:MAG TPA: PH domain-containing protein [Jatrophihabitans sp.]